jgi:hypothetical protein
MLLSLGTGKHPVAINGVRFVIFYDEAQALGDNGKPVKGDKTGEWEVFHQIDPADENNLREVIRQHVSPHGTSKYGNPSAPRYSAERVAEAILRVIDQTAAKAS